MKVSVIIILLLFRNCRRCESSSDGSLASRELHQPSLQSASGTFCPGRFQGSTLPEFDICNLTNKATQLRAKRVASRVALFVQKGFKEAVFWSLMEATLQNKDTQSCTESTASRCML